MGYVVSSLMLVYMQSNVYYITKTKCFFDALVALLGKILKHIIFCRLGQTYIAPSCYHIMMIKLFAQSNERTLFLHFYFE